jgi:putative endonuclease
MPDAASFDRQGGRRGLDRAVLGRQAEDCAAHDLERRGLQILLRNYRRRGGELDIVARDGDVLVVVEVRLRSSDRYGGAAASVDGLKRMRIVRTTRLMLQQHRRSLAHLRVRFDVALVRPQEAQPWPVEWIHHAFDAT